MFNTDEKHDHGEQQKKFEIHTTTDKILNEHRIIKKLRRRDLKFLSNYKGLSVICDKLGNGQYKFN